MGCGHHGIVMDVYQTMLDELVTFKNSPNILALLEIIADPIQDVDDVVTYLNTQTDVDTAEGVHLDALGDLIGVPRPLAQEECYLKFVSKSEMGDDLEHKHGWQDNSASDPVGGYWQSKIDGLVSQTDLNSMMSDTDYRRLIKTRISAFRIKSTHENIFLWLLNMGARCLITKPAVCQTKFETTVPGAFSFWECWYILDKGLETAGISKEFDAFQLENDEGI